MKAIINLMGDFSGLTLALFGLCLAACEREETGAPAPGAAGFDLTITSGFAESRTVIEDDGTAFKPYWSGNEKIGVYTFKSDGAGGLDFENLNIAFPIVNPDNSSKLSTATFSGTLALPESGKVYAYSPYLLFEQTNKQLPLVRTLLPTDQFPARTSFDPAADLMIARPQSIDPAASSTSLDMQFKRMMAIVKLTTNDIAALMGNEQIQSVKLTFGEQADGHFLAGRVLLDVEKAVLGGFYSTDPAYKTNFVTAKYTAETGFAADGTQAVWLMVYPRTIPAQTTYSVEITTQSYTAKKTGVLAAGLELVGGVKVNSLNVTFAPENVVGSVGAALPLFEDFDTATKGLRSATGSGTPWGGVTPNNTFIVGECAELYQAVGAIRIGKASGASKVIGKLTTKKLDLSKPFRVTVKLMAWTATPGTVRVTAGGKAAREGDVTYEAYDLAKLSSNTTMTPYTFTFPEGAGNNASVVIETISNDPKAFVEDLSIEEIPD